VSGLIRFLYLLALGLWIGEVVCFSFLVAPALFAVLDPAAAADVTAAIFPGYYRLGAAAAATAVACALAIRRRASARGRWTAALLVLTAGLAATLWAGAVVRPRAQRLRAAAAAAGQAPAENEAFRAAHRLAVMLNGAALLAGLAGLGLSASALGE